MSPPIPSLEDRSSRAHEWRQSGSSEKANDCRTKLASTIAVVLIVVVDVDPSNVNCGRVFLQLETVWRANRLTHGESDFFAPVVTPRHVAVGP